MANSSFQISKVRKVLLGEYKSKGYEYALSLADQLMIHPSVKTGEYKKSRPQMAGVICETVLEIITAEFIKVNKLKDWGYSHSLILGDVESNNSSYLTEIDFVVYSPHKIFLFECKSYKGDKNISGRGNLSTTGSSADVFEQHRKHAKTFMAAFNGFMFKKVEWVDSYRLPIFLYSEGEVRDIREDKWKSLMPAFTTAEILQAYEEVLSEPKRWNVPYVRKAIKILENRREAYGKKHLDYVKSLHSSGNNSDTIPPRK